MSEWKKPSEWTPEIGQIVVAISDSSGYLLFKYEEQNKHWLSHISHWLPLPPVPEGAKNPDL